MGRPLLTDDIIEKARRMETFEPDDAVDFDTKVMTLPEKDEKHAFIKAVGLKMPNAANCNPN